MSDQDIIPQVPGLLELLQDMSSYHAPDRISVFSAYQRMHALIDHVTEEQLQQVHELEVESWPHIPRPLLRLFSEILRGLSAFAWKYILVGCSVSYRNMKLNSVSGLPGKDCVGK
jgi:hypothetical protein